MAVYKTIGEFIETTFPQEVEKLLSGTKTPIQRFIEAADEGFGTELEAIIKGEKKDS